MIHEAVRFLAAAQNGDGGWPAHRGRSSATEPTSFAVLALATHDTALARAAVSRGVHWLASRQLPDGSWPVGERLKAPSWTTSVATLALAGVGAETGRLGAARAWLVSQQPRRFGWLTHLMYRVSPKSMAVRLDPALHGWPWVADTASFVEPTSYALLALGRLGASLPDRDAAARRLEAESLLYDRVCPGGGWNYGNSVVLGENLPAFADQTALALIALQKRADRVENRLSLALLPQLMDRVGTGLALAWGTICLSLYGQDTEAWRRRLAARYNATGFLEDIKVTTLAMLACGGGAAAFRVA